MIDFRKSHRELGGSFFAYDLDAMSAHLKALATPGLRLWYACKANPLSAVLECVHEAGFSLDVASIGELRQALRAGVPGARILLTGPVKSTAFLQLAFASGVRTFVAESRAQLEALQALALEHHCEVDVLLRLQLEWEGAEKSVLGGSGVSAFGLSPEDWGVLPEHSQLRYRGVHVFQWGNVLSVETLGKIWDRIAEEAKNFAGRQGFALDVLDLGGGLGISYKNPAEKIDWEKVRALLPRVRELSGAGELWLELGRYAVGPFGSYVTEVIEKKSVRGHSFLLCAGGAQHLVRPALVGESFPARVLEADPGAPKEDFFVHGPLCTALDRLGTYSLPASTEAGDLLVFAQTGAYGFTESMPYFLCHDLAGEIVVKEGQTKILRPVQSAENWLK